MTKKLNDEQLKKAFKAIDRKYEKMTEEELDELYIKEQLYLSNHSKKQLDAQKRNGYTNVFASK